MKKRIIYILSTLALVAIMVVILLNNKRSNAEKSAMASQFNTKVIVETMVASQENYSLSFSSNGTVEAYRDLAFMSDVAGRVKEVLVDEGSRVSQGSVMVRIDDEMLMADFKASEASYNSIKTDYERFKNAHAQGGVTDQQLDNMRMQLVSAESRYISSKRRLNDASIKSPISGTINKRYIEVGAYLNPGAKLFDIVDDSRLKVWVNVTERQLLDIQTGDAVTISCDTHPTEAFNGIVNFIGKKSGMGLSYPIEINITNKKQLRVGNYVSAHFETKQGREGILVPRSAISGSVKGAKVYVVNHGIAQAKTVVLGDIIDKRVELLSGVSIGDTIITTGLINVSEGTEVQSK